MDGRIGHLAGGVEVQDGINVDTYIGPGLPGLDEGHVAQCSRRPGDDQPLAFVRFHAWCRAFLVPKETRRMGKGHPRPEKCVDQRRFPDARAPGHPDAQGLVEAAEKVAGGIVADECRGIVQQGLD